MQYWKSCTDQVAVKDERGKPLKDAEGNTVYRTVQLDKPKVFNAEQIEVCPRARASSHLGPRLGPPERAEVVLRASATEIRQDHTCKGPTPFLFSWLTPFPGYAKEKPAPRSPH